VVEEGHFGCSSLNVTHLLTETETTGVVACWEPSNAQAQLRSIKQDAGTLHPLPQTPARYSDS